MMRRGEPRPTQLPELSFVQVPRDVSTDDGLAVPAGSRGTIVAVWGEAYEVEFSRPVVGLATVRADGLRAA